MAVAQAIVELLKPIQKRYKDLLENKEYLENIYIEGSKRARQHGC